jgi:hypothetical protein
MGGARLPGRERSRGRGARLTGGVGVSVVARARGDGPLGPREGEGCGGAREGERGGLGRKRPSRGGFPFLFFFFYFLFLFSISISFISFSFEQIKS